VPYRLPKDILRRPENVPMFYERSQDIPRICAIWDATASNMNNKKEFLIYFSQRTDAFQRFTFQQRYSHYERFLLRNLKSLLRDLS